MTLNRYNKNTTLYIHIFPSTEFDWDCIKVDKERKVLQIRDLFGYHSSPNKETPPQFWKFRTDGIFSNSCQSDVYATVRQEIMESVFLGTDHVVMSFGQNNSGKTFLISGLHNQFDLRGLVPRFVSDLFMQKDSLEDEFSFNMYISAVDIYNNSMFDLLTKYAPLCKHSKEVKQVHLTSTSHCFHQIFKAESQRKKIGNKSYNSHLGSFVVTFTIKLNSFFLQSPSEKTSKIHFVDLAGVETVHRNQLTSFKDQQSQGDANVTKTLLEIFALRCQKYKNTSKRDNDYSVNQRTHILTRYLGDSFSPCSVKTFFCHIRPNHVDLMIALSLLKFGMAFKFIPTEKIEVHLELNAKSTIKQLKDQVEMLQEQILIQKNLCPMEISQGRIEFVKRMVELFIKGELSQFELMSTVDDCSLISAIMKTIINEKSLSTNVATQTDYEKEPYLSSNNILTDKNIQEHKKSSLNNRISSMNSKESYTKGVSFKTTKDPKTSVKRAKMKGNDKVDFKSEGVQVNLIESNLNLPTIDSREHHWAAFLICMPEIQEKLDKLILSVREKSNILNASKLKYDALKSNLINTQMKLNALKCSKLIENPEENGDRLSTLDKESNLLTELKFLEKELEINKQFMITNQIEWLDALQIMTKTKQYIEQDFKEFCSLNNYILLDDEVSTESVPDKSTEIEVLSNIHFDYLEDLYNDLQKKYLFKHSK